MDGRGIAFISAARARRRRCYHQADLEGLWRVHVHVLIGVHVKRAVPVLRTDLGAPFVPSPNAENFVIVLLHRSEHALYIPRLPLPCPIVQCLSHPHARRVLLLLRRPATLLSQKVVVERLEARCRCVCGGGGREKRPARIPFALAKPWRHSPLSPPTSPVSAPPNAPPAPPLFAWPGWLDFGTRERPSRPVDELVNDSSASRFRLILLVALSVLKLCLVVGGDH